MKLKHDNISQKKIWIMIVGVMITLLTITILINKPQAIGLKNKSVTLEYGELLSMEMTDYLDLNQTKKDIVSDIKMDTSSIIYENGKDYPAIGNYEIILSYKNEKAIIQLNVKDTIAPVFQDFLTEVEFMKGKKPSDEELKTLFSVEDLDKTTVIIDHSQVDYTKVGVYKTTVTASDSSHNKEVKDIMVNISEPTLQLNKTNATLYEEETFVLKAEVKGNDSKITFQSSDTSIVEVNNQGRVTAIKSGTATIIAEANGIQAKCHITVQSLPNGAIKTIQEDEQGNQVTVVKPPKMKDHSSTETSTALHESGETDGSYDLASAKEAFQLQNSERAKQGLPALQWNDSLYETAKIRAKEIVKQFSHTRPNGGDIFDMIQISWKSAGENIGMGTPLASSMVNMWMNSAGHKANILADNTHAAVAKYGNYWVTIFVKQ